MKRKKKSLKKIGLSPGSLIFEGEQKTLEPSILICEYNLDKLIQTTDYNTFPTKLPADTNYWIDIRGVHDSALIQQIGERFKMHRLVLEDVMDTNQRAKVETYDNGVFAILPFLRYNKTAKDIDEEQIGLYLTEQVIISFQEDADDSFTGIRKRLETSGSRMRQRNSDYLFYALIDYIVDHYYVVLDAIEDEINELEEHVYTHSQQQLFKSLFQSRALLLKFRKQVFPVREQIFKFRQMESKFIEEGTLFYMRDAEDHLLQINDLIDNQRELLNSLRDLQMNITSFATNQELKWLTVVSTIAIPLMFLTGVYGMNFEFMPELKWQYAYPVWWLTIIVILILLVLLFRKRKLL